VAFSCNREKGKGRQIVLLCTIGEGYRMNNRLAHMLGVLGFCLSLAGLGWQVFVYRESLKERALVRLSATYDVPDVAHADEPPKKGSLAVELVNIGQRPLYVKEVALDVPCPAVPGGDEMTFHTTGKAAESDTPLAVGAAAIYQIENWDFAEHPLDLLSRIDESSKVKDVYCVIVSSNRGEVQRQSELTTWTTVISASVPRGVTHRRVIGHH
jgi:hypothetical protein